MFNAKKFLIISLVALSAFTFSTLSAEEEEIYLKAISDQISQQHSETSRVGEDRLEYGRVHCPVHRSWQGPHGPSR